MREKVKGFWEKTKTFLKKLSKKVYIAAAIILAVLIVGLAAFVAARSRDYAVLVTGVSTQEAGAVLEFLRERGVSNYKIENDDTILVPKSQEANLKAGLLMENIGKSGFFYSTYKENVSALSTEAERNNAWLMDVQERMGATIACFDNVRQAVVNITPGEDRGYVLDSNNVVNATAGVLLTMAPNTSLTSEEAAVIRNFVSTSVQGLKIDDVKIGDTFGNNYPVFEENGDDEASTLKLRLEAEWANRIRTEVMSLLSKVFGEENVQVGVNCEVEVGLITQERHEVGLPEYAQDGSTGGRGVISSESDQYFVGRPAEGGVGGAVGTETNADIAEQVEAEANPNGTETELSGSSQTDYDNSYTDTSSRNPAGRLSDCSIAVVINSAAVGTPNLDEVRHLVARAAGIKGVIDETTNEEDLTSKISVMAADFYGYQAEEPNVPGGLPSEIAGIPLWVIIAAAAGLLLFLILLVVILLIRRKRRKKREAEELALQEGQVDALLEAAGLSGDAAQNGADVMDLQTERSMELRKDIRQFASDNPEIAAQMLKIWLRGGDENG